MNTSHPAYVIVFTLVIAAAFTAAVVSVQVATQDTVNRNEERFLENALLRAFDPGPGATRDDKHFLEKLLVGPEMLTDPQTGAKIAIWRAYKTEAKEELDGIAFQFEGKGFWDTITGIMAVTPDLKKTIGLAILSQKETPGLGGRITEPDFQKRFAGLTVTPPDSPDHRTLYITNAEPSNEQDPRYNRTVDAITGATQTCMALERLLDRDIAAFQRAVQSSSSSPSSSPSNKSDL